MEKELKLIFYGGVGTATGANIMLSYAGKKILVDCGLLQGEKKAEKINFEPFKYNPKEADFLLITHAHMDHIGKVPKLVAEGFGGKIISTVESKDLASPMLEDALRVTKSKHGKELFSREDIEKSLSMWEGMKYGEKKELFPGCKLEVKDAGHVLGSAIMVVSCDTKGGIKTFAFTGDLGNSPSPLLRDAQVPENVDFMIIESVYGDRNHEEKSERREKLKRIITEGISNKSTIIIPAFSIERTQVLLYELNNMIEDGEIPRVQVFFDSPLALKVTEIYKKYENDFKPEVKEEIRKGDDIFNFPGLEVIKTAEESRDIEKTDGPKIILSGSGMSEGGRVINHEIEFLGDENAIILLVGYQAAGTLGRRLQDGGKEVEITTNHNRQKIKVRARIENITGYSSHMDSEHLLEFVEGVAGSSRLKKVFCIMGETKSSLFLAQRIRDYLGVEAIYPEVEKEYKLE